jgi:hypothetical protein
MVMLAGSSAEGQDHRPGRCSGECSSGTVQVGIRFGVELELCLGWPTSSICHLCIYAGSVCMLGVCSSTSVLVEVVMDADMHVD